MHNHSYATLTEFWLSFGNGHQGIWTLGNNVNVMSR